MKIQTLKLFSTNLNEQEEFYSSVLGFETMRVSEKRLEIQTQENILIFEEADNANYYHFAFLIPTGSLESAIAFLESKSVPLIKNKGEKIIHFNSGRAIYFYDADNNITEFIERPTTNYKEQSVFSISEVIKVNEIGFPVEKPLEVANKIVSELGIQPTNQDSFSENFCWVGDHHGVIIVTKLGRNWLPTDNKPALPNAFEVVFEEHSERTKATFSNGRFEPV